MSTASLELVDLLDRAIASAKARAQSAEEFQAQVEKGLEDARMRASGMRMGLSIDHPLTSDFSDRQMMCYDPRNPLHKDKEFEMAMSLTPGSFYERRSSQQSSPSIKEKPEETLSVSALELKKGIAELEAKLDVTPSGDRKRLDEEAASLARFITRVAQLYGVVNRSVEWRGNDDCICVSKGSSGPVDCDGDCVDDFPGEIEVARLEYAITATETSPGMPEAISMWAALYVKKLNKVLEFSYEAGKEDEVKHNLTVSDLTTVENIQETIACVDSIQEAVACLVKNVERKAREVVELDSSVSANSLLPKIYSAATDDALLGELDTYLKVTRATTEKLLNKFESLMKHFLIGQNLNQFVTTSNQHSLKMITRLEDFSRGIYHVEVEKSDLGRALVIEITELKQEDAERSWWCFWKKPGTRLIEKGRVVKASCNCETLDAAKPDTPQILVIRMAHLLSLVGALSSNYRRLDFEE